MTRVGWPSFTPVVYHIILASLLESTATAVLSLSKTSSVFHYIKRRWRDCGSIAPGERFCAHNAFQTLLLLLLLLSSLSLYIHTHTCTDLRVYDTLCVYCVRDKTTYYNILLYVLHSPSGHTVPKYYILDGYIGEFVYRL